MIILEKKQLFREFKGNKLYFGIHLDYMGNVYKGYAINDENLDSEYILNSLLKVWNSLR